MYRCVVHRSGSVPSETTEPTYGVQAYRCVFIKALQSKDFSEILLICVNFLVTAHGFKSIWKGKMLLHATGHKTYYGLLSVIGVGRLSYLIYTQKVLICTKWVY